MSLTSTITPQNLDEFLPWACRKFQMDFKIIVFSEVQDLTRQASQRTSLKKGAETKVSPDVSERSKFRDSFIADNVFKINTVYDNSGNLIQFKFDSKHIPRVFLKIIGLTVTYHEQLNNITITQGLNNESLYELSKLLPLTYITEICLDKANIPNADYGILLENEHLIHLSLCQCQIDDDMFKLIANKLSYPLPASESLTILNLASNKIGDTGAKYLASALKYNRRLAYLNISDNSITDEGVSEIFSSLKEFLIAGEELLKLKAKKFLACKEKQQQSQIIEVQDNTRTSKKKIKSSPSVTMSKKKFSEKDTHIHLEENEDPFAPHNLKTDNGQLFSTGNNTLAYLNLSYNHLSYMSLNKLLSVLLYQQALDRSPRGLVNVRIDGNCIPTNCRELQEINQILLDFLANLVKVSAKKKNARK